jgi:hypothetical protein
MFMSLTGRVRLLEASSGMSYKFITIFLFGHRFFTNISI